MTVNPDELTGQASISERHQHHSKTLNPTGNIMTDNTKE